jgi:hypothetical protein
MQFIREILDTLTTQLSRREIKASRTRLERKPSLSVQLLEGRTMLSHVGIMPSRRSSALVARLQQRHGRGADDGALHHAADDKGGRGRGRGRDDVATRVTPTASRGRNGADDPATHHANDDRGTLRNGADDPPGHNANDDRGGHGKHDGKGHK